MKSTKFWVILVAVLLAASLLGTALTLGRQTGTVANVYLDGRCIRSIDLSQVGQAYSFTVEGPAGTNTVLVEPGRICVSHAGCPDQVCVRQGWIATGVAPIVCLPNRLVIQIEDAGQAAEIDGVAG